MSLRHLFERAVGGFYRVALANTKWSVILGQRLSWQSEGASSGIPAILLSMKIDIALEHPENDFRLVIDTKFNEITTPGYYRKQLLRSGYIYQMYAYLRSQERACDPQTLRSEGMMLHRSVGRDISESGLPIVGQ